VARGRAWEMAKKKDARLSEFYWRIKAKRGAKKAIMEPRAKCPP
jgi:hypothetical protein